MLKVDEVQRKGIGGASGSKWRRMGANGGEWELMGVNGSKWEQMGANGSNWEQMGANGGKSERTEAIIYPNRSMPTTHSMISSANSKFPSL